MIDWYINDWSIQCKLCTTFNTVAKFSFLKFKIYCKCKFIPEYSWNTALSMLNKQSINQLINNLNYDKIIRVPGYKH